ncbi:MAG: NlpC/P60 family protein, partial [Ancalomicrobiaceae bacterium]|nr:NlpC/P60 family protein [Ancalomicrobiaceae bacterium]
MPSFDRRFTPARSDLAAIELKGMVAAPRYVEGAPARVIEAVAPIRVEPRPDAGLDTEALYGEQLTIYDEDEEGWAWVQLQRDGYVGYAPGSALLKTQPSPATHVVAALRTFIFPGPTIKEPPVTWASLGSQLRILREVEEKGRRFGVLESGAAVVMAHAREIGFREPDPVAVAERFLGTPYLWGGKSSLGIDCSGLVQTALNAAGAAAPRDSDLQETDLGLHVSLDPATWR